MLHKLFNFLVTHLILSKIKSYFIDFSQRLYKIDYVKCLESAMCIVITQWMLSIGWGITAKYNKYKIAWPKLTVICFIWLVTYDWHSAKIIILRGYSNIASECGTRLWKLTCGEALDDSSLYARGIFVNWGLSEMLRFINWALKIVFQGRNIITYLWIVRLLNKLTYKSYFFLYALSSLEIFFILF